MIPNLEDLIAIANARGAMVALLQSADGKWQCNLNAFVNRMYYVCFVDPISCHRSIMAAMLLWDLKMERDGPPARMVIEHKAIDIDSLLEGL